MNEQILSRLRAANTAFNEAYPGDSSDRQAVHTVYGGAHLFKAETPKKIGGLALKSLEEYAPTAAALAEVLGLRADVAERVYARVTEKLRREPVEDFRIDFEDGYGNRPDAEEDAHATQAAQEVARGLAAGSLPPFLGIRVKPFTQELADRAIRTLDLFLRTLDTLPANFVVTLPKVTVPEQVAALAEMLPPAAKVEIMIETPQSIIGRRGEVAVRALVDAAGGRCGSAHFGTYDYTAGVNITAQHQDHTHPACDFARHVMQVSLAGTGVNICDGATTVMPVAPHKGELTPAQREQNRAAVHRAWKLHFDNIRHSLRHAFYQGWDLHPAQLPVRYAAVYAFFLEGLEPSSVRLRNFLEKAAQATLSGHMFDDAATGQGLLNFFLRGLACGAITEAEALGAGITLDELRSRSFVKIVNARRK